MWIFIEDTATLTYACTYGAAKSHFDQSDQDWTSYHVKPCFLFCGSSIVYLWTSSLLLTQMSTVEHRTQNSYMSCFSLWAASVGFQTVCAHRLDSCSPAIFNWATSRNEQDLFTSRMEGLWLAADATNYHCLSGPLGGSNTPLPRPRHHTLQGGILSRNQSPQNHCEMIWMNDLLTRWTLTPLSSNVMLISGCDWTFFEQCTTTIGMYHSDWTEHCGGSVTVCCTLFSLI